MNLRPVIEREMRRSSRQVVFYYSRLVPAGGLLACAVLVYMESFWRTNAAQVGAAMFVGLQATLFSLIWLIVPLTTADVISREKREDTLGLLLLTPLRAHEVVVSKMISSLISGAVLILAGLPIIAIPILLGGVTGFDLMRILLIDLSALIGAVTAGVVTSSVSEKRGRAWFACLIIGALWFSFLYSGLAGFSIFVEAWGTVQLTNVANQALHQPGDLVVFPLLGWMFASGLEPHIISLTVTGWVSLLPSAMTLALSWILAWAGVGFAASKVRRLADSQFQSARRKKVNSLFTRERFFVARLKRSRGRSLTRNPAAWLVTRKWTFRLAKWGWLLLSVFVLTLCVILNDRFFFDGTIEIACIWLGLFMLLSILLLACSNLQAERGSGALELLLVTHLAPESMVRGRLKGIRGTFLQAMILILGVLWFMIFSNDDAWEIAMATVASLFFLVQWWFLPVIGLCFSMNRPGVISAVINTVCFAVLLPWFGPMIFSGIGWFGYVLLFHAPDDNFPWIAFLVFCSALVLIQASIAVLKWKGKLNDYPRMLPHWMVRLRLGWIAPWMLAASTFLFFLFGGDQYLTGTVDHDEWPFLTWHIVAWTLLMFFARGARLALIDMLEKRTFLGKDE